MLVPLAVVKSALGLSLWLEYVNIDKIFEKEYLNENTRGDTPKVTVFLQ